VSHHRHDHPQTLDPVPDEISVIDLLEEWTDSSSTDGDVDVAGWVTRQLDTCISVPIPINSLALDHSLRRIGTSTDHVRVLAEAVGNLPPILVHGPSRKVIDGAHRVRAAVLRGESKIGARIYSGSLDDAFVLAVNLNSSHGLPLSRRERATAAERILRSHPQWSDRMIAGITGLSAGTIGNLRQESTDPDAPPVARIGKDGRARPVDSAAGRSRARQLLAERPTASIRSIAKEAGVSASTVLNVRRLVAAGQDPVERQHRANGNASARRGTGASVTEVPIPRASDEGGLQGLAADAAAALTMLLRDPSMRLSAKGRFLLRWMTMSRDGMHASRQIVDSVPDHCASAVAKLARSYAVLWTEIASGLEGRFDDKDQAQSELSGQNRA